MVCFSMPKGLRRRYGLQHLHFITCSCYRRLPLLSSARARNAFVKILSEVRDRYQFKLAGYVVMPQHIHLLISEPPRVSPSRVMQVLKQRVSRQLRRKSWKTVNLRQLRLPFRHPHDLLPQFWQPRFYDFNVWSQRKFVEKLHYMHMNPLKSGPGAVFRFMRRRNQGWFASIPFIDKPKRGKSKPQPSEPEGRGTRNSPTKPGPPGPSSLQRKKIRRKKLRISISKPDTKVLRIYYSSPKKRFERSKAGTTSG